MLKCRFHYMVNILSITYEMLNKLDQHHSTA